MVVIDTNSSSVSSITDDDDPVLRKRHEAEAGYELSHFDGQNWEDAFEAMQAARRE